MIIRAYDEMYLDGAMHKLAEMMEFAVLDEGIDPDAFFKMFLDSGIARSFEIGDVSVVAGRSGHEIADAVILNIECQHAMASPSWREDRSDVYWAGWVLAYYQWYRNLSFARIWKDVSIHKLLKAYPVLHEADVMKVVEVLDSWIKPVEKKSIRTMRRARGWSQAKLAELSGLSVSQLQRLEYGERSIENLSVKSALRLASALGVTIEELG